MHDDIRRREQAAVTLLETEAVDGDVTGDDPNPPFDLVVEPVAPLLAQAVEAVVPEDLAPSAVTRGRPSTGAHEEYQLAVRHGPKEALDERRTEKARGARHCHALARERLSNHAPSRALASTEGRARPFSIPGAVPATEA